MALHQLSIFVGEAEQLIDLALDRLDERIMRIDIARAAGAPGVGFPVREDFRRNGGLINQFDQPGAFLGIEHVPDSPDLGTVGFKPIGARIGI